MRILNNDSNTSIENIIVYLKREEAVELVGALEELLNSENNASHSHVNDLEYAHEITVAIYDENDLGSFNQRSKQLIQEDI